MKKLVLVFLSVILFCVSSLFANTDFRWGNVMMGGGGFVSAIITSKTEKNLIYARTDVGGAYRWNEAGKSWIPLTDWLPPELTDLFGIDALALCPQNPSRVYMFAGTGYWAQNAKTKILRSDDYGNTFDMIDVTEQFKTNGNGMGRQSGERLAVDPNNPDVLFIGTRNDGLFRSTDRGSTWSKVESAPTLSNDFGISIVLFDSTKTANGLTSRIFIGLLRTGTPQLSNNFYVSNDAGATWELLNFPAMAYAVMPQRAVITPGGRFVYVAAARYPGPWAEGPCRGALLRLDTDDWTWKDVSPENLMDNPPGDGGWNAYLGGVGGVSISASDSNFIVASTISAYRPQLWEGRAGGFEGKHYGDGDKIYASKDGGNTWINVFGGLENGYKATGNEPYAVLYKNGFNWIEGESIHWAGSIEIDPFDPKRVWVISGNGVYMADNFSPGQRFRFSFMSRGIEETVPLDMVSIPGGPLITVIMDYDGFVHDNITQPVRGSRHTPGMGDTHGLDFAKLQPNIVVRSGGEGKADVIPLQYSLDTGRTWTPFFDNPSLYSQNRDGKVAVSSDGRVVLWWPDGMHGGRTSTMHRTGNWGETWTQVTGVSSDRMHTRADPEDPAVFYALGSNLFRSSDTGKTFARLGATGIDHPDDMQVTPGRKGHIWVAGPAWDWRINAGLNGGRLARSTDGGETFHDVHPESNPRYTQNFTHVAAIGFGMAAPGHEYPAIYVYGTIGGVRGIWQSIDEAASWVRVDDDRHRFGMLANGNFVRGDMNTFGVVYRSTAGRGVAARMPVDWHVSVRPQQAVMRRQSPYVNFRGQVLTLTPPNGSALTVSVYDLRGRQLFNKAYTQAAALRPRDMVRSNGTYIITVRDASRETIFSGRVTKTRRQ